MPKSADGAAVLLLRFLNSKQNSEIRRIRQWHTTKPVKKENGGSGKKPRKNSCGNLVSARKRLHSSVPTIGKCLILIGGITNIMRNRKLSGKYPYVYVDGIYLKRNWGGEFENVSILVAIGVDEDGYREIIGASDGMKEDAESWKSFLVWLKERGLDGVKLIVGDKCLGMCNAVA